MQHFGITFTKF